VRRGGALHEGQLDGERAEFVGGGATPNDVGEESGRTGARSELICEGIEQRLEVITSSASGRMNEQVHKIESMRWVAAAAQ